MGDVVGYVLKNPSNNKYTSIFVQKPRVGAGGSLWPTASEAMRALDNAAGRFLQWTRDDLDGGVERWRANDPGYWPGDYSTLKFFYTAECGIDASAAGARDVESWGSRVPASAAGEMVAVAPYPAYVTGAKPQLSFDGSQQLTSTSATFGPPLTIGLAASFVSPPIILPRGKFAPRIYTQYFALKSTDLSISVYNGNWIAEVGRGVITGPAPTGANQAIVVTSTSAGTEMFIDGVSAGTCLDFPPGILGTYSIGDAGHLWNGTVAGLVGVNEKLGAAEVAKLTGYLRRLAP